MVSDKIVFNDTHNLISCPGGVNIFDPKPTHRLFLCCSNVPTKQEIERSKSLLGKIIEIPFRFESQGGGEV